MPISLQFLRIQRKRNWSEARTRRVYVLSADPYRRFRGAKSGTGPDQKRTPRCVKYWQIIADSLKKSGWSLGWVLSNRDRQGVTIQSVDAHGYRKRFIVGADDR